MLSSPVAIPSARSARDVSIRFFARRIAIQRTPNTAFHEAWCAWQTVKGENDIPEASAIPTECLRPIVGHFILAMPGKSGAFAYAIVGQGLRQLGWEESLRGTWAIDAAPLRKLAEEHLREVIESREPSLYEVHGSIGDLTITYQRLALPIGGSAAPPFLLLALSIDSVSMRRLGVALRAR